METPFISAGRDPMSFYLRRNPSSLNRWCLLVALGICILQILCLSGSAQNSPAPSVSPSPAKNAEDLLSNEKAKDEDLLATPSPQKRSSLSDASGNEVSLLNARMRVGEAGAGSSAIGNCAAVSPLLCTRARSWPNATVVPPTAMNSSAACLPMTSTASK